MVSIVRIPIHELGPEKVCARSPVIGCDSCQKIMKEATKYLYHECKSPVSNSSVPAAHNMCVACTSKHGRNTAAGEAAMQHGAKEDLLRACGKAAISASSEMQDAVAQMQETFESKLAGMLAVS